MDAYPHVSVELRPNAGFSRRDKQAAMEAAHYAVYEHSGVVDAGTRVDLDTMAIEVDVKLAEGMETDSLIGELKSLADDRITSAVGGSTLDAFSVVITDTGYSSTLDSQS